MIEFAPNPSGPAPAPNAPSAWTAGACTSAACLPAAAGKPPAPREPAPTEIARRAARPPAIPFWTHAPGRWAGWSRIGESFSCATRLGTLAPKTCAPPAQLSTALKFATSPAGSNLKFQFTSSCAKEDSSSVNFSSFCPHYSAVQSFS